MHDENLNKKSKNGNLVCLFSSFLVNLFSYLPFLYKIHMNFHCSIGVIPPKATMKDILTKRNGRKNLCLIKLIP